MPVMMSIDADLAILKCVVQSHCAQGSLSKMGLILSFSLF